MSEFSVHDQPDFAPVYTEDDEVTIRKGDLRALLDVATGSMDFSSGFWDEEQTEIARKVAQMLGIDPGDITPKNMMCKYEGHHEWRPLSLRFRPKIIGPDGKKTEATLWCWRCEHYGTQDDFGLNDKIIGPDDEVGE